MTFRCDNPTCTAVVVLPSGLQTRQQIGAALIDMGWKLTHDSLNWVAICPRCIRGLVDA